MNFSQLIEYVRQMQAIRTRWNRDMRPQLDLFTGVYMDEYATDHTPEEVREERLRVDQMIDRNYPATPA
jgi:hypothetical protein